MASGNKSTHHLSTYLPPRNHNLTLTFFTPPHFTLTRLIFVNIIQTLYSNLRYFRFKISLTCISKRPYIEVKQGPFELLSSTNSRSAF